MKTYSSVPNMEIMVEMVTAKNHDGIVMWHYNKQSIANQKNLAIIGYEGKMPISRIFSQNPSMESGACDFKLQNKRIGWNMRKAKIWDRKIIQRKSIIPNCP